MTEKTLRLIQNRTFGEERALYNIANTFVENCRFEGEEDGESFLKECRNISVKNCYMDLRYPMWHVRGLTLSGCEMTKNCRAALWYDRNVHIENCTMNGIKAVRECRNVTLLNVRADSPEFGWKCTNVAVRDSKVQSEYAFLECKKLAVDGLDFEGKYSFQYTRDVTVKNSRLKTKDAFWHAKNATVTDCVLESEYLGWYSDGLTLVRCTITGTQPLCYCKNLTLIDCTMEGCDLAFEYSEVNATILGTVRSVKNPLRGVIVADGYGEIIKTGGKYRTFAQVKTRTK